METMTVNKNFNFSFHFISKFNSFNGNVQSFITIKWQEKVINFLFLITLKMGPREDKKFGNAA